LNIYCFKTWVLTAIIIIRPLTINWAITAVCNDKKPLKDKTQKKDTFKVNARTKNITDFNIFVLNDFCAKYTISEPRRNLVKTLARITPNIPRESINNKFNRSIWTTSIWRRTRRES